MTKAYIPDGLRELYVSDNGNDANSGASLLFPKKTFDAALTAAAAATPAPGNEVAILDPGGSQYTVTSVIPDSVNVDMPNVGIVCDGGTAISAGAIAGATFALITLPNVADIGYKTNGKSNVTLDLNSMSLEADNQVGVENNAGSSATRISVSQVFCVTDGCTLVKFTGAGASHTYLGNTISMRGANSTGFLYSNTSPVATSASVGSILDITSSNTGLDVTAGHLVLTSNDIVADIFVRTGGILTLTVGMVVGDITVEAGGILNARIAGHLGTVTNNGTINGPIFDEGTQETNVFGDVDFLGTVTGVSGGQVDSVSGSTNINITGTAVDPVVNLDDIIEGTGGSGFDLVMRGTANSPTGGSVSISGGGASTTGGSVSMVGGTGGNNGGAVFVSGGEGPDGTSGDATIRGGNGDEASPGGDMFVGGGNAGFDGGKGGDVVITSGTAEGVGDDSGDITIDAGTAIGGGGATIGDILLARTAGSVGVGASSVVPSAVVQIDSTTQGVLFPRMTTAQRDAIPAPALGLTIHNLTTNQWECFDGSSWVGAVSVESFDANSALYPSSNPAAADSRNAHPIIAFDDTVAENVSFGSVVSAGYTGGDTDIHIDWVAATATTGGVTWGVEIERNAPGGTDIDSDSFAAQQTGTSTTNGTSGIITRTTITLTQAQADAIEALDSCRIRLQRVVGDGGDDLVGDAQVIKVGWSQ